MKFAEHLNSHITPEWRKQYIQYDEMKVILYKHQKEFLANSDPHFRVAYRRNFNENFFGFCQEELDKVSSFYNEKQAYYSRILLALKAELPKFYLHATGSTDFGYQFMPLRKKNFKRKHDLENAFSELYLGLVLLQNFQQLNYTAFRRILRKYDKLYESDDGSRWFNEKVEVSFFHIDPSTDKQITEIEEIVTEAFEGRDKGKAMQKLKVPPLNEYAKLKTYALGIFTGALGFSVQQIALTIYDTSSVEAYDWHTIIRLYRGYLLANLYIFLAGVNVMGWRQAGVNHVLIFGLDPRSHSEAHDLFTIAAFLTCALALSFIGFLEATSLQIPIYTFPLLLLIFYILFLVNPFNCLWREPRYWLIKNVARALTAGFHSVNFTDFWLMDQTQSLTPMLLDLEYTICTYGKTTNSNEMVAWWHRSKATVTASADYHEYCSSKLSIVRILIRILPSLVRFIQCIRRFYDLGNPTEHLMNAGKYLVGMLAITSSGILAMTEVYYYPGGLRYTNPAFYLWILFSIFATIYGFYWDVARDWGLFDPKAEVKYLREELVYNSKYYYYAAMVLDLFLRFSWAISLSITENKYISADIMLTVTAPLEIARRFAWNFFRLENEHLNNVGDFRTLRDITIRPIPKAVIGSTVKEVRQEKDETNGEDVVVEIKKIRQSVNSDHGGGVGGSSSMIRKDSTYSDEDDALDPTSGTGA